MKPLQTFAVLFSLSLMLTSCGAFKDDCDCPNVGYMDGQEQKKQVNEHMKQANATTSLSH